jgi:hypothetical protein
MRLKFPAFDLSPSVNIDFADEFARLSQIEAKFATITRH